jgi:hypothetical protein
MAQQLHTATQAHVCFKSLGKSFQKKVVGVLTSGVSQSYGNADNVAREILDLLGLPYVMYQVGAGDKPLRLFRGMPNHLFDELRQVENVARQLQDRLPFRNNAEWDIVPFHYTQPKDEVFRITKEYINGFNKGGRSWHEIAAPYLEAVKAGEAITFTAQRNH